MDEGFNLTVTVPAVEMAFLRRRLMYLEAVLVQLLRHERRVKEWFTVAELADLRLPGLPRDKSALTRLARSEGWKMRKVPCKGGQRHLYHFSSLPRHAFEALIDRIVQAAASDHADDQIAPAFAPAPAAMVRPTAPNAAPPWVLPLMRIIRRQGAAQPVSRALEQLPKNLPAGVACPTYEEAMQVLRTLGMVAG